MKHIYIILLGVLIAMSGCRKDEFSPGEDLIVTPNPEFYITANVNGIVTEDNGTPIMGALVELGSETTTTDDFGFFRFKDALVDKKGGVLTFSKNGYFNNYKVVYPQLNRTNTVKVIMPNKDLSGSFNTSAGGPISTNGGASVTFPQDGIMTEDGQPYSGEVNVYAHWYDPASNDLYKTMPGNLRGQDEQGNEVQLATYGMMAVELESPDGTALNLSEGKSATLEFPLGSLSADSPADIPLWSFDEEKATWIEEGRAVLDGDKYVGEVSHFSFWNCDAPFPLVEILGVVKDTEGNLIPWASMCFEIVGGNPNSWFSTAYGYTNEFGEFFGKIPKDKEIRLTIKDECGNIAYEEVIGPFGEDVNLGIIEVQLTGAINVTGSVVDCNGDLISNGYVVISYPFDWNPEFMNTTIVEVNEDGTFNFMTLYCGPTEVTVQAYDFDSATYSDELTVDVVNGEPLDLGVLSLCNEFEEYITYTVNGGGAILIDVVDLCILDGNAVFTGTLNGQLQSATFIVNNMVEGTNTAESYQFITLDNQTIACVEDCDNVSFEVTSLGTAIDEFVEGTFNGTVTIGPGGDPQPFEGSFKVKIDYIGSGSSISGVVWDDLNADGIRTSDEPLVENEFVYLYDINNDSNFQSAVTGADGAYSFDNLKPGTYQIGIETNFGFTTPNAGGDDTVDSDFTPNGVLIELGDTDQENVDAGLLITNNQDPLLCSAWGYGCELFGFGEIFITASGGLPPYTYLLTANQPEFPQTNTEGYFGGLMEGTYVVSVFDANGDNTCETVVDVIIDQAWVTGSFWFDENGDGMQNEQDTFALIDDIVIELIDNNGNVANTYVTSNQNTFFDIYVPYVATYTIKVTAPDGYVLLDGSTPNGWPQFIVDEMDPTMGETEPVTIEECEFGVNLSIGIGLE